MKIQIPITVFLFFCSIIFNYYNGQSQSRFIFKYSTLNDEIPNSIIETSDHGFIIASETGTYGVEHQQLLLRIDQNGDTLYTKTIIYNAGKCGIESIIKLDDGTYLGIGSKVPLSGKSRLWLLNFNDSLRIIKDTTYSFGFERFYSTCGLKDHLGYIIVYGSGFTDIYSSPHSYIFRCTQTLDSIQYNFFNASHGQMASSMLEKPDTTGYLLMITGNYQIYTNSPSQILTVDYSLNVIRIDSIPDDLELYLDSKILSSHEILISGKRTYQNSNPRTDKYGIVKLDTSFLLNKEYFLGPNDTITYPGVYTNLDFIDPNKIFCGGTINFSLEDIFSSIPSYILIGRFDSALNLTWQKYFGGDQYYIVRSLTATSDGGCIISSTSYDYKRQNQEQDLYVIKIDSNGLVTGQNNLPPISSYDAIVYPNPGNELIYIETQLKNAEFYLYDLTGREVCSIDLDPGRSSIPVQNLPSGFYVYKVLQNSQVKEYGKWIKE